MTGLLKKIGHYLNVKSTQFYVLCLTTNAGAAMAGKPSTGQPGTGADPGGVIAKLGGIVGAYSTFMSGTAGKAIMVGSVILAVGAWVMTPREGVVGVLVRLVAAGVVIMNAVAIVDALGKGKT